MAMYNIRHAIKFVISLLILLTNLLYGQCPEKSTINKSIYQIINDSSLNPKSILKELLQLEVVTKNCNYNDDSTYALLLRKIGGAYYSISDYEQAIKFTQQAINFISKNASKPNINFADILDNYNNLIICYNSLGLIKQKNLATDSCIIIAMGLKLIDSDIIYWLWDRTDETYKDGDYERCYDYADMGLTAIKEYTGEEKDYYKRKFLIYKFNILLLYKKYDTAEYFLLNQLKTNDSSNRNMGVINELLAEAETHKSNYKSALLYYNRANKYFQKDGYYTGCLQTLNNLGNYLYFQKYHDNQKALTCYKRALSYQHLIDDNFEKIDVFRDVGNVYVQLHAFDSAFFYFQSGFDVVNLGFNEKDLLNYPLDSFSANNKNIVYLIYLIIDKADAFVEKFKVTENKAYLTIALNIYHTADIYLNKITTEHSEMLSKLFWRNDSHRLYEHAIEAAYILGNLNDAFYFFEKSRAVLLSDQMNEQHWIQQKDIAQKTELEKIINSDKQELKTVNEETAGYEELQNRLFFNKLRRDSLNAAIKAKNPLYFQSFFDSSFISVKDVQNKILKDQQALIELFTGDSSVYVLCLTKEKNYFTQINKADYDSTLSLCIKYASDQDLMNRKFEIFKNASSHLYRLLFSNITVPAGRIVISPDENYFPFEALVTNSSNNTVSYFLNDHAISYTYSARYLMNQFNTNSSSSSADFIGFAPVNYRTNADLATLEGSSNSLQQLKTYFSHSDIFTNDMATKNNFLINFQKYKVIQLYTHATDNGTNGEPAIYFSDSVLNLSELISENLPVANLIVLSACETGSGKVYEGEGVFSFNRSFAALGIPAAINNLWSADNDATYKLTELFYKYVAKGMPTDVALQKAKIEFINSADSKAKAFPYYWASTVLTGKANPIEFKQKFPWQTTIIILSSLVIVFFLWKRKFQVKTDKAT
jgi:CHAT domain-containing protein